MGDQSVLLVFFVGGINGREVWILNFELKSIVPDLHVLIFSVIFSSLSNLTFKTRLLLIIAQGFEHKYVINKGQKSMTSKKRMKNICCIID